MTIGTDTTPSYEDNAREVINLKLENTRLQRELAAKQKAAEQAATSNGEYPRVDPETGRMMYGSWDDMADPFVDKFHPRNTRGDVAFDTALRDRAAHFAAVEAAKAPKLADDGIHLIDPETGEMIPTTFDLHQADMVARQEAALTSKPVFRYDAKTERFVEWLYPDVGEYDEKNDLTTWEGKKELERRERERTAAYISNRPRKSRHTTTVPEEMRALGLLPPLPGQKPDVPDAGPTSDRPLDDRIAGAQAAMNSARRDKKWDAMKEASRELMRLNTQKIAEQLQGSMDNSL